MFPYVRGDTVIASEAKQSGLVIRVLDCFVAPLLAMTNYPAKSFFSATVESALSR